MIVLGFVNLALVLFQLFTGLRIIKIPFSFHKRSGITLTITAFVHALIAISINLL